MYETKFNYKDANGVDKVIMLKPVPAVHYKKIISIGKKFKGLKGADNNEVLDRLDDTVIDDMITVCNSVLKISCPDWSDEDRDSFIVIHLMSLVGAIFSTVFKEE